MAKSAAAFKGWDEPRSGAPVAISALSCYMDRVLPDDRLDRHPLVRLSFILSLWMSLATALVCAIVPAGLPATRSVGSAFDPSTTIVALRSRPPVARPTLLRAGDDDAGEGLSGQVNFLALPATVPVMGIAAVILATVAFSAARSAPPHPRAFHNLLYARPPPAA